MAHFYPHCFGKTFCCSWLLYSSPLVMFLDNGNPCFWKFHFMVPFDTFLVNCLFDPACVAVGILSSKTNQLMKEGGCWIKWLFQSRTLHLEERLLNFQFLPANNFWFHCWLLHHPYCCFLHTSTAGKNLDLSICLDHTQRCPVLVT